MVLRFHSSFCVESIFMSFSVSEFAFSHGETLNAFHSTFSLVSPCIHSDVSAGLHQDQRDWRQSICTRPSAVCGKSSPSAVGCSTAPQDPQWPHRKSSSSLETHDLQLCTDCSRFSSTDRAGLFCHERRVLLMHDKRLQSLSTAQAPEFSSACGYRRIFITTVEMWNTGFKQQPLKFLHFIDTVASKQQVFFVVYVQINWEN